MQVQPYLFFNGRCEEAAAFYGKAIGARVTMLMRFKDNPDPMPPGMLPPGHEQKVMHMSMQVGDAELLASDGMGEAPAPDFRGFSLTLTAPDERRADELFAALGDGGRVTMPMGKTFFAPRFGMLVDRFGVNWMVIVPQPA